MSHRDPNRDPDPPSSEPQPPERERRSTVLPYGAWVLAASWSVYLLWSTAGSQGGGFGIAVRIMGSAALLYLLYLLARPRYRSVGDPDEADGADLLATPIDKPYDGDRRKLIAIVGALAIGALAYRLTKDNYLHQSSAFFIGVPAALAILLALTPRAKSATGLILKGLTLALLLSGIVFFEGFVCILMAAPLFYLVGIAVGVPIDRARRNARSEGKVFSFVGAALMLLSVEGVTPATSFPTHEVVRTTRTLEASVTDIRASLAARPDFDAALPFYLKLGFPRPRAGRGRGLQVGDRRMILFGDESPMEPMEVAGRRGRHSHHHAARSPDAPFLELEIVRSEKGRVVFEPVRDATAFTHWIGWGRSIVEWQAVDADTTRVTWTLHFGRRLSPSWYFGPWQRYAAGKAAGYLIESVATP